MPSRRGNASTICCAVHPAVGESVTLKCTTLLAMLHEDYEHVEQTEGRRRHDEEVDGDKVGDVVLQECPLGLRGWLRAPRHETRNGALRHIEAELE